MKREEVICLAWATKKRHIAIDGCVLCEPKHITTGYSVKNGGYNTLSLSGLPTYRYAGPDKPRSHADGIISNLPLSEQGIITSSICSKCLKKFNHILSIGNNN